MKKIFFALLSASMVLFAACQQEPSVKVSDGAEVLGYKPSTYDIKVESAGSWTLEGDYDWITPSKTSGNSGETISFTTTLNTTGLIRTADYTVVSNDGETTITLYQKSGDLDAVLELSVVEQGVGTATLAINLLTSNSDDYAAYGVYYGTSADFSKATRMPCGTDVSAGTKLVELTDLNPDLNYFAWAYVESLVGDEVVSSVMGILPPVEISSQDVNLQDIIDEAAPYSEIRFLAGLKFEGNFTAKSNVRITGGWNADFTSQSNNKEDYLVLDAKGFGTVMHIESNIQGFAMNRVKIANGNDMDGAGLKIDGKAVIEKCWFDNNYATHRGGAIGSTPDGGLDPGMSVYTIANCLFTNNAGKEHGSAFCVDYNCNATFVNNLFYENHGTMRNDYWHVYMTYAGGVFVNNTFVVSVMTNGKSDYGIFGARVDEKRTTYPLVFVNNILVDSQYAAAGDGQYPQGEHPVAVGRNKNPLAINSFYTRAEDIVKNNLIEGNADNNASSPFNDGNTILTPAAFGHTYPELFVDYANRDFSLVSGSAVDVGSTTISKVSDLLKKYNKDFAGNPRVVGASVDLGCFERQ